MSGRVRHTLADGRRVVGYRKTLQQRRVRTPTHLLPEWRLTFILPEHDMRFLGLQEGPVEGLIGVRLLEPSICLIAGKNSKWVIDQAVAFMRKIAPGFIGAVNIVLTRDAEPGPTLSGPLRSAESKAGQLRFGWRDVNVIFGTSMRVLPAAGGW